MLPILLLLDPDSLLALGKCSKRLFRLVCDQEVWRHLVKRHLLLLEPPGSPDKRIPEFHLERLKDLAQFAAKSDTRQDMTAEVLKQRAKPTGQPSVRQSCWLSEVADDLEHQQLGESWHIQNFQLPGFSVHGRGRQSGPWDLLHST